MKDFTLHSEALELKQLGFDEPCFAYYNIDPYLKSPAFNLVKPFDHEWCLPAPLFQQAFRWFREKYNLNYVIVKAESWFYTINGCNTQEGFNTYEEAELACLKKLIEIVKGGNK